MDFKLGSGMVYFFFPLANHWVVGAVWIEETMDNVEYE